MSSARRGPQKTPRFSLGGSWLLLGLLLIVPLALLLSTSLYELQHSLTLPAVHDAIRVSLLSTAVSVVVIVMAATPLAWWLATSAHRAVRVVELWVQLPIFLPPTVVGVGLLQAFGARGLWGHELQQLGYSVPFTLTAVVLAQVVIAAPFYIQAAANAFRQIDDELYVVARTLGASPREIFYRIAIPMAWRGLVVGASLAWARALGEFGATLVFAGNRPGVTQTLPVAIYTALETDVSRAGAFAVILCLVGLLCLGILQGIVALSSVRQREEACHPSGVSRRDPTEERS